MKSNLKLLRYSIEAFLAPSTNPTLLIYDQEVQLNGDVTALPKHITLTGAEAFAIMDSILSDSHLIESMRHELRYAKQFPDGNIPNDQKFRMDPNRQRIEAKIIQFTGAITGNLLGFFSLRAYEFLLQSAD